MNPIAATDITESDKDYDHNLNITKKLDDYTDIGEQV